MKYKSICIAGVDGTGKSSTVRNLQNKLGLEKAVIQYMGARQWESKLGKRYFEESYYKGRLKPIMWVVSYVYEMYYRYYKHKGKGKIVIFDRYAYEHAIFRGNTDNGFKELFFSFIYRCAFLWFYPKPTKTFYLVCPLEVSLSRKTDITTTEEIINLEKNKKKLDEFYNKKKGVVVIDTTMENEDQVISHILDEIKPML